MKKLFLLLIMAGFTAGAFAQVQATASTTATVVTPIGITNTVDMNFGNVATSVNAGTVALAPAGTRAETGGVTLPATGGTFAAASFDITGEGAYTYAITLPSTDYIITETVGSIATMTVNAFTSTPSGTGALTAGVQTLTVGATLNVGASQASGTYTNASEFEVSVNYN